MADDEKKEITKRQIKSIINYLRFRCTNDAECDKCTYYERSGCNLLRLTNDAADIIENAMLHKTLPTVPAEVNTPQKLTRETVLESAKKCVCGQREDEYGTPEKNFETIADFWSTYKGVAFSAKDVAMMMALLKVARIKSGNKQDSFIDLAGYAACAAEVAK